MENVTDSAGASDMQVKEEPEDAGYGQTTPTPTLSDHNFISELQNSSPISNIQPIPLHTIDYSPNLNQSGDITNSTSQIPLNDLFAGSTIRSQLHGTIAGVKMDAVQNIVESLLKKNETLLAMSDAGGFKPNPRRVRAAHDGFVKRTEPTFPSAGQVSAFPVSPTLLARVSASKTTTDTFKHHMIRPKSPTRRYDGMLKDKTHFTYALMESNAADQEIETIFNVQNHELVCAIGSKSLLVDKFNKIIASLEFGYFWCNFCPFSTNNKNLLTQHVLEHRFCCKYCAYESFCRSDIVRHMHKTHHEFKDAVSRLSYCTLLSDYLRVKTRIDEKENKDPDEDIGNIDQDKLEASQQELAGRKHKMESDKECASSINKFQKIDDYIIDYETQKTTNEFSHNDGQGRSRKSHCPMSLSSSTEADYDIFDMEVEEGSDGQYNTITDECESDKFLFSSNHSSPGTFSASNGKQPIPTGMVQVVPSIQNISLQTITTSHDPNPTKTCPRGSNNKSYRGNRTSSLYWSCGYCTFQSNSQAEIKDHSNQAHPGKPHRYVALIKNLASDSLVSESMKGKSLRSSAVTTLTRNVNHSPQVYQPYINATHSSQISNDSKKAGNDSSDETVDIVSLKEKDDSPSLLKVKLNSTKMSKKEVAIYKCYHCLYTAKRHWTMKSHIYHKHKGMGLVAVDNECPSGHQVFFCARDDCTFKSENVNSYFSHIDQCTPWNKPELADVEVEPHIRECLEQTMTIAAMAKVKV